MLIKFIVCFLAGIGAGLGTGFAGMSAAAVISPMLITFLHMPAYEAVGIALASDVLASAISAYTYGKNKNLDIKNGLVMMVTVLLFTLFGSYAASKVPNSTMGGFSVVFGVILFIFLKFEKIGVFAELVKSILFGFFMEYLSLFLDMWCINAIKGIESNLSIFS